MTLSVESCLDTSGIRSPLEGAAPMASPVFKPSTFIRSVVIVLYFLVFCSIELSFVLCAGAPVYPPAESPALTPVATLAPGPAPQWREPGCGLWPVNYQAYERMCTQSF